MGINKIVFYYCSALGLSIIFLQQVQIHQLKEWLGQVNKDLYNIRFDIKQLERPCVPFHGFGCNPPFIHGGFNMNEVQ